MHRVFQAVVLTAGAVVSALPFASYIVSIPASDVAYELTGAGVGVLLLFSPYIGLAMLAERARRPIGYGALALLLAGSAFFHAVASTDPQACFVALYVIPAQWLVAVSTASSRFARSPDPADSR